MAFLCPVRMRKGKKKKDNDRLDSRAPSIGRITGSASIETLVRVGLEKEHGVSADSKMVVLHDFMPCVDDELEVKRGQIVNVLYQENDWVYVIAESNQEGFIPHSYCAPVTNPLADMVKHKKPRNGNTLDPPDIDLASSRDLDNYSTGALSDVHPFYKDPAGKYVVLYTFIARDENDVSVERGEFVTVLNKEDPDWYWIVRSDGHEGFVPSAFVCPTDLVQGKAPQSNGTLNNNNSASSTISNLESGASNSLQVPGSEGDSRFHGTELVMLYDYKAQAPDDLSVRRGDWVYADLNNQTVDGWLWAFAPKLRKYGFIPKAYARPPAMTSL